jgi:hypothetical protein
MTFRVQKRMCATCIYRPDSPLDLKKLENDVRDKYVGFRGHRVCHHSKDACCRGFWQAHKDDFAMGQIAQRLRLVEFVEDDEEHAATGERS